MPCNQQKFYKNSLIQREIIYVQKIAHGHESILAAHHKQLASCQIEFHLHKRIVFCKYDAKRFKAKPQCPCKVEFV